MRSPGLRPQTAVRGWFDGGLFQAYLDGWTRAQLELWRGWLAMLGAAGAQRWDVGDQHPFATASLESMRAAAERLVVSQAQWAAAWTAAQEQSPRD
jgi:hypothetical protein